MSMVRAQNQLSLDEEAAELFILMTCKNTKLIFWRCFSIWDLDFCNIILAFLMILIIELKTGMGRKFTEGFDSYIDFTAVE